MAKQLVIVDAMFSWRVANLVRSLGYDAIHVDALGQIKKHDHLIWKIAEEKSAIVLTRDADFLSFPTENSKAKLLLYAGFNSKRALLLQELEGILPNALKRLTQSEWLVRIP